MLLWHYWMGCASADPASNRSSREDSDDCRPVDCSRLHGLSAEAQEVLPVGDELQVTPVMPSTFSNFPDAAVKTDGDFLVVWQRVVPPGPEVDIFGRLYSTDGSPLGDGFQINPYTTGIQFGPRVVGLPDGEFVVAWSGYSDASGTSIQAQLLAFDGSPVGDELLVNTYTTGNQLEPAVAAATDGRFVIAWRSSGYGIRAQRFAADGSPQDVEFQVDSHTTFNALDPVVASAAGGDFVVAWTSDGSTGSDTSSTSIQARRFSASGVPVGEQFQVNTYTTGEQVRPSIAAAAADGFVVVWQTPNYGVPRTVRGRRFGTDGMPFWPMNSRSILSASEGRGIRWSPPGRTETSWSSGPVTHPPATTTPSAASKGVSMIRVDRRRLNSRSTPRPRGASTCRPWEPMHPASSSLPGPTTTFVAIRQSPSTGSGS